MIEQRVVELGIRPRRARELVEVKPDLPATPVGPPVEAANEPRRRRVEQNSSAAEAEAENSLGDVVSDAGKRAQSRAPRSGTAPPCRSFSVACNLDEELGAGAESERSRGLDRILAATAAPRARAQVVGAQ